MTKCLRCGKEVEIELDGYNYCDDCYAERLKGSDDTYYEN